MENFIEIVQKKFGPQGEPLIARERNVGNRVPIRENERDMTVNVADVRPLRGRTMKLCIV